MPCWLKARRTRATLLNEDFQPVEPNQLETNSELMCAVCGQSLTSPISDQEWDPDNTARLLEHQQVYKHIYSN